MYKNKKILAIIPARGGSKRIKNKNIKLLHKKPLIYYSIKTALNCKIIDKIVVSTDSKKIAKIAKQYGAEIPFLRPKKYAQDKTSDQPVIKHCFEFLKKQNENYDYILYLKPTAPLRTPEDILKGIKTIYKYKLSLVRSVTKMTGVHHPFWMYTAENHTLKQFIHRLDIKKYYRSQLLPQNIVALNGIVEIFSKDHAIKSDFIYNSKKMGYIEIPSERAIDIDKQIDFDLVQFLMKK